MGVRKYNSRPRCRVWQHYYYGTLNEYIICNGKKQVSDYYYIIVPVKRFKELYEDICTTTELYFAEVSTYYKEKTCLERV